MRYRLPLQPRYVVAATALVTVLMLGTAFVELRQSREEIYHLMREEAVSLAETIHQGGTNAILSMDRIEDLLASRLLDNAFYIARLDSLGRLRQRDLAAFAAANGLFRVNIFNRQGTKVLSSITPESEHEALPSKHSPRDILAPILSGSTDRLIIGIKDARVEDGQRFAVAVRRTRIGGGAIVVNMDAADLLAFRRSIGIGKLIQDLGDNSGITYVALQDPEGIIAASRSVQELSSMPGDEFLRHAMDADTTLTRVLDFQGTDVFEVVLPFAPEGQLLGVLRIALAMDEVRSAEARMGRRMLIMSLVVIVLGALAVTYLMVQQNYRTVERKYASIKTFTGNILSEMRDGVVTVDRDSKITIFNRCAGEILGLGADEFEGQTLEQLGGSPQSVLRQIFSHPDGIMDVRFDRVDGLQRDLAVSLSTTLDSEGLVESRTAVLRDLTDARRLERQAQRRDKLTAMGELASGVAHEIRNPLNAIAMIAQRFAKEFVPRSGLKEYRQLARVMQDEARRVNGIIRQFLAFARPPELHRRDISLASFLEHLGSVFSAQATAKGVKFFSSTENDEMISLDSEQMTQALLNLLQNALEATPPGGTVSLKAKTLPGNVQFMVADTGSGIAPDLLDKIFNLYFTSKHDGTGLGLPITQQIVGQHGGSIEVSSTESRGTVFTILLPQHLAA